MKMIDIGTNMAGDPVYNVVNEDGTLFKTTIYTKAEAQAIIVGDTTDPEIIDATANIVITTTFSDEPDYMSMSKIELEKLMRMHDVELDRRKGIKQLRKQVKELLEV